jgi:hypothetical protein
LGDLDNPEIWEQLQRKHPERKQDISEDAFEVLPEEEVELKVEKILPKLDMNAAPGPSRLRNGHIRIWAGAFAPPSVDEAIEWLKKLLTDMANDMMPAWIMHAIQAAKLMALVLADATRVGGVADHKPVQISNTLAKVGDKAVLEQCQAEYAREMMPQQVDVGVKFAAEVLAMGLRMVLHLRGDFILISTNQVTYYFLYFTFRNKSTLDTNRLAHLTTKIKHISRTKQLLSTRAFYNSSGIYLRYHLKGYASGDVCFDQTGDNIYRWSLSRENKVYTHRSGHLSKADDRAF